MKSIQITIKITDKENHQYVRNSESEYRMKKDMEDEEQVKWMSMVGEYYRGQCAYKISMSQFFSKVILFSSLSLSLKPKSRKFRKYWNLRGHCLLVSGALKAYIKLAKGFSSESFLDLLRCLCPTSIYYLELIPISNGYIKWVRIKRKDCSGPRGM